MKTPQYTKCIICDKGIGPGEIYVTSKPKKGPEVYAHRACLKLRKERKHG